MRLAAVSFLLLAILAGCGKDSRLQGKWTFDREYTTAQLPKQPEAAKDNGLLAMKQSLNAMLVPMLLDKLDGSNLTITRKEIIMTTKEGSGQAQTYEVIERPADDTWRVKTSDGKVETYSLENDRLASPTSGDVNFKAYFKRTGK